MRRYSISEQQLFRPRTWKQLVVNFAREMHIPFPVVTFSLVDGSSFNVRSVKPLRDFALVEAYDEELGISLRFVPWPSIRDIEVKKEKPEVMEKMGYTL